MKSDYQQNSVFDLSIEEQQKYIDRIKKSNTFSKTSTSRALLQYLFDATQKGTNLKEGVIEIEFFRKSNSPDKNDARVRVNIFNLRKKLQKYYEKEGENELYQVKIEKGQYQVKFEKQFNANKILHKQTFIRLIPYLVMVGVIIISVIILLPANKPLIWKSFFSKKVSTTLYVGDVFGIYGKTMTGRFGWIRDYNINSLEDLYEFSNLHPELKDDMKPANYSYSTDMAVLSTKELQSFFQKYNGKFNIRFNTKSSISDIIDGHAIYIGPIKNNNPFIYFFNKANPYFKIEGDHLTFSGHPSLKDTSFNLSTNGVGSEYAIVTKIPGPNETTQLIFFSNHDIGVTSTVEYFTEIDSLKNFQNKYLNNNKYFTALFLADGKDRTNTNLKLILAEGH